MKNQKVLKTIDHIVFGAMCLAAILSRHSEVAVWCLVIMLGYFISSIMHTPEYFEGGD